MGRVVNEIPENFTGADFSALTTEAYMIAVKEKIIDLELEIAEYKVENKINPKDEIMPETYLKLKYSDEIVQNE